MLKMAIISTVFTTAAFQAPAEPLGDDDLSGLPADFAARVIALQAHGERFEPAIRAIFAAARRPTWSDDGCGHDIAGTAAVAPQS